MSTASNQSGAVFVVDHLSMAPRPAVPWQVWVVVLLFALEGISNLLIIPQMPVAAFWLAMKCLMIVGLLRRWRWVFVLTLIVMALHVLAPALIGPTASLVNLVLLVLTASTLRFYFPARPVTAIGAPRSSN